MGVLARVPYSAPLGSFDCSLHSPSGRAFAESSPERFFADARVSREFGQRERLPFVLKEYVRFAVIGLLAFCCPATIARLVITEIIGPTIKRVIAFRALTHIRKEVREYPPSFADGDPVCLVVGEAGVSGVCAASDHVLPAAVGSCSFAVEMRVPMHLPLASARRSVAAGKLVGGGFSRIPANAPAKPQGVLASSTALSAAEVLFNSEGCVSLANPVPEAPACHTQAIANPVLYA